MNYKIIGDSDCPMLHVELARGESINVERGGMAYMQGVSLEGKMNTNSGLLGALGRTLTSGESFFISKAVGQYDGSFIGIAPPTAGQIKILQVDSEHQYRFNTGAFLACDSTVKYYMKRQKLSAALFANTGGFYVAETSGYGELAVSAYGSIIEVDVTPEKPLTVDNAHVVCWSSSLDYNIAIASGVFGFKTGEGIVNVFKGYGKVYLQTRNIAALAGALIPFMPSNSK